jgi:hypothetical protein
MKVATDTIRTTTKQWQWWQWWWWRSSDGRRNSSRHSCCLLLVLVLPLDIITQVTKTFSSTLHRRTIHCDYYLVFILNICTIFVLYCILLLWAYNCNIRDYSRERTIVLYSMTYSLLIFRYCFLWLVTPRKQKEDERKWDHFVTAFWHWKRVFDAWLVESQSRTWLNKVRFW